MRDAPARRPRLPCPQPLTEFDAALQTLAGAVPQLKRRVMLACAACVLADQHVSVRESELLRAVGDMIGAPLPPLVVKQEK